MNVLLIEDNEDDWILITEFLWGIDGVTVHRCATLAQGLDYLQNHAVDVLLLDMGLPDSYGLQTFVRVKTQHPTLPVVILSGDGRDDQALAAVHSGAQDYLVKGEVTGALLVRSLRYAEERKQAEVVRQRYAQTLETLQVIDHAIIHATSVNELAHNVFNYLQQLIPFQGVSLVLVEQAGQQYTIFDFDLTALALHVSSSRQLLMDCELDHFHACLAACGKGIRLVPPHHLECNNTMYKGMQAAIQAPLIVKEGPIGLFTLVTAEPNRFHHEHLEILAQITTQLAVAIDRLQLMKRQANHAVLLEKTVAQRTDQLRAAKERAESILNHSLDGMVLLDSMLTIQQVNPAFHTLFQESNQPADPLVVGSSLLHRIAPDDTALIAAAIQQCLATCQERYVEALARRRDGSLFDMELSIGYVDEHNVVCTMRDISVRKAMEAALQNALAQEKELNQLKSQFVAMASHEFRTPLAAISVLVESLMHYRHRMTDEQVDQRFTRVKSQVSYLTEVMDDVLCLARLQSKQADFNPSVTNLDELCRTMISEFASRPDVHHHIQYSCRGPQRPCLLDERLMRQVFGNLLSNAIKYSPNVAQVAVHLDYQATAMVLSVQDAGIGIPDDAFRHLFEPFHRANNATKIAGTGLGLTITKESIERHQGTIAVDSVVGQGTTFTVTIPIVEPAGERAPSRATES